MEKAKWVGKNLDMIIDDAYEIYKAQSKERIPIILRGGFMMGGKA